MRCTITASVRATTALAPGVSRAGGSASSASSPHLIKQMAQLVLRTLSHAAMMDRIRAASLSIANGFVSTCMPGSKWPLPMAAFSA